MATIKIRKSDGGEVGSIDLSDAIFGIEPNTNAVRAAVNQFQANQRRGTHSTKTRGFVRGGGKKPWKQKGTGRARQGSIRSPQWRGGAIIFGPSPRDYSYRVNHKVKQIAFRSVYSELARTERLIAIENFNLDEPKTKNVATLLKSLGVQGSAILLTEPGDSNIVLAARNMPFVTCLSVESPNIYDLLTHDYVVATSSALKRIEAVHAEGVQE